MEVPIVFCFDKNHAAYAAVATHSLLKNAKFPVQVYWIVPSHQLESITRYSEGFVQSGFHVSVLGADDGSFSGWREFIHITRAAYLKLLAPSLLSHQKALYLDTDTLVVSDISKLLEIDIGDNLFAGVPDPDGAKTSKVPMRDTYINSGVLLMNLKALREDGFLEKTKAIYSQYEREIMWADQCLINKYAEDKKLIIGAEFNRQIFPNSMTGKDWDLLYAGNETKIFHFLGPTKPWMEWCNPSVRDAWWAYANALKLDEVKIIKADTLDRVLLLAGVLHLNEKYQEASTLKTDIINALMAEIKRLQPFAGPR